MHPLLRAALAASFALAQLNAQQAATVATDDCWPWRLSFATAEGNDADVLREAFCRLAVGHDRWIDDAPADLPIHDTSTGLLLAWLWLGDDHRARAVLHRGRTAAVANGDPHTAAWSIVHHYWFLRATGDSATVRAAADWLAAQSEQIARAAEHGHGGIARDVLWLHATACMGGLLDTLIRQSRPDAWRNGAPRPAPGAGWALRAAALRQAFEQRYWSATTLAFTTVAMSEDLAERLVPCAIGMLATTGDRTLQNLRTTLRAIDPATAAARARELPLVVVALAQCEVDLALPLRALTRSLADRANGQDLGCIGRALDAILFAWTGVRMASGPGIDEDWLRLRPRLPESVTHLQVRGLRHDGWTADLQLQRRHDALTPGDRELLERCANGKAADAAAARLHGRLIVRGRLPARGYWQAVVHCGGRQLIAPVFADAAFDFAVAESTPDELLGQRLSESAAPSSRDR